MLTRVYNVIPAATQIYKVSEREGVNSLSTVMEYFDL